MRITLAIVASIFIVGCTSRPVADTTPVDDPNTRTVASINQDTDLVTRIERMLSEADPAFDNLAWSAHVNDGHVLLVGRVPEEAAISLANELVLALPNVASLHNHLRVGPRLSTTVKANDTWLRVRIHSAMFNADDFPSRKVDVIVVNGVVYLMGDLSESEGRQGAQLAAGIEGVQQVVTLFQP